MRAQLAILVALGACGNGHGGGTPGPDTPMEVPACDFIEANDGANAATPEMTNVELGVTTRDLCGTIDHGHFDMPTNTVDVDTYRVTVSAASADLVVQFFGGTGVASLGDFSVLVFDTQVPNPTLLNGAHFVPSASDHGVFVATLPSGTYDLVVTAKASADLTASIDYKVRIAGEQRAMTCAIATTPAMYAEANDQATNHGNDVMQVNFAKSPAFAAATGTAEPTGLTIDAAAAVHVTGSSAQVAAGTDQYLDRDTYQVATSATANELVVRLAWPGSGADLDEVVFGSPATPPVEIGYSTIAGTDGAAGELARIAVKPSTPYLVWVGATKASTGTPVAYDLELCGVTVDTSVARN